jgi:hypothetical protein
VEVNTRRQAVNTFKHGIQLGVLVLHEHAEVVDCFGYFVHTTSLALFLTAVTVSLP